MSLRIKNNNMDDDDLEVDADMFASERSEMDVGATCRTVPRHPEYGTLEARRQSFPKRWKKCENQSPDKMAEAGFFYAKSDEYTDGVYCFHCGVLLKYWEPGDLPWTEHIRFSNTCDFTRQVFGVDEVEKRSKSLKEKELEETKQNAISELREMGYTKTEIYNALEDFQNNGKIINTSNMVEAIEVLRKSKEGAINLCLWCKHAERQIMFLPCSHTVSCAECARRTGVCYRCQADIRERMRVYMS